MIEIAPERVSPLIEELDNGRYRVTVCFHDPEAEEVWIIGGLAGAEPADRRMRRAADGWWERTYELSHGVRTGYAFTRTLLPSGASDLVPDPLNPHRHVYPGDPEIADGGLAPGRIRNVTVPSAILVDGRRGRTRLRNSRWLVGATGFEPATFRPPAECATRLRHAPKRATGIEPALRAWKARVQPQHFARA